MIQLSLLSSTHIPEIVSLVKLINTTVSEEILAQRFSEMFTQNYECIGMFNEKQLIGCCGVWYQTRHYSGKSAEPDHVVILPEYRNQNLGDKLMQFCIKHAKSRGCETVELNCYLRNKAGQKFWERLGFRKLGYHSIYALA